MPATQTAVASECFVALPLRDITGPHDPHLVSASEFAAALERAASDLPAWPLVIVLPYGPAPECLFDQPMDAFKGPIARFPFIGQTRRASRFAKEGFAWYARPAGSTMTEGTYCRTYSEALHVAADLL
jgi:hypothetical protein